MNEDEKHAERPPAPIDPAIVAAIIAAVARMHPAARVVQIEAEE